MPEESISSVEDILSRVKVPRDLLMDVSACSKGIDNYHIDVELHADFVTLAHRVIEEMVKRTVAGKKPTGHVEDMENLRDAYEELIKGSLHRTKTDLSAQQVQILHFAIIKFVLAEVRSQLDLLVKQLEETLGQQQYSGSRSLLVTQERFARMRRQYPTFMYRANRAILKHLQKEENNQLRLLREQLLGAELAELPHILFNPLLAAASPMDPQVLLDSYSLWGDAGKGIGDANAMVEAIATKRLPGLPLLPLKPAGKYGSGDIEIYDELGGLFAVQPLMGASQDLKDQIAESFCWLDHPGNVRLLFDPAVHDKTAESVVGIRAKFSFKSDVRKLAKVGDELRTALADDAGLKEMMAGHVIRENWHPAYEELIDIPAACAYVAGRDTKKMLAKIDQGKEGALGLIKQLDEWSADVDARFKESSDETALRVLTDFCRFRLHLKYYRLAHRMFNRLQVITEPQQIQLAKAGGKLYRLTGPEAGDADVAQEPEIIHHTILKADVRGSTVVTQELIKQSLNPASYFSTRFFGPINELLGVYGAVKVFIEGDAVILGIYEENTAPDQWYSVSRACGIAKEVLDIVGSKNTHSRQTGLPALEIGIGICYADERPLFLFDADKPIMISRAIGDADRMSSSSWKLRQIFEGGDFNVEVLEIAETDRERGEKGQHHVRYNVNGILLADDAFSKLKSEITLKKMQVDVGNFAETFYVGRFPDLKGKERDLVIREGLVGRWANEKAVHGVAGGPVFYEVLPNAKLASQVLEIARAQAGKT